MEERMGKLAYFFDIFPGLSTTFLQREVYALKRLGVDPVLVSWRPPESGDFHPGDAGLLRETFYVRPFRAADCRRSVWRFFSGSPSRFLRGVKLLVSLSIASPGSLYRYCAYFLGAMVLADYFAEKDVAHVHVHFAFGAAGVAVFLNAMTGMPYSVSIHGSDALLPQPLQEEKLRSAGFIVSNCRYHIEDLKVRYPSLLQQRFHLVRLGLELDRGVWADPAEPAPGPPLRILNVARLHPVKGHEILIAACGLLKKGGTAFHCKIVGGGPRRRELEDLVSRLDLRDCVEFTGPLHEEEVAGLFNWAHVMVLSSLSEGTPMTAIEAMAMARPVVAPRITALPEIVEDGGTGVLFPARSAEGLAQSLERFAETPRLIAEMGSRARRCCENVFDINKNARLLRDIFLEELESIH